MDELKFMTGSDRKLYEAIQEGGGSGGSNVTIYSGETEAYGRVDLPIGGLMLRIGEYNITPLHVTESIFSESIYTYIWEANEGEEGEEIPQLTVFSFEGYDIDGDIETEGDRIVKIGPRQGVPYLYIR